ncbi:MAG: thermonuclease family protein, partial [Planctomycetota bacterium]
MSKRKKITYAMSRRRRTAILVFCLLVAAVIIRLEHSPIRRKWQRQPQTSEQVKAYDFEKYHTKTFTVIKVVDGDTLDINIPNGKYEHTRIRLWGIDAPEKNQYFGAEAGDFAQKLALGEQVTVYLEEHRTRGKYGRLLAYVQLADSRFLNEVLVAEGLAYADSRFQHSFYHKYE